MSVPAQVKIVGINGQISLGKEFSGKMVLIDQVSTDTWVIKSGTFVPDSEKWLYQNDHLTKLDQALDWAKKTKPTDNFDQLAREIKNG